MPHTNPSTGTDTGTTRGVLLVMVLHLSFISHYVYDEKMKMQMMSNKKIEPIIVAIIMIMIMMMMIIVIVPAASMAVVVNRVSLAHYDASSLLPVPVQWLGDVGLQHRVALADTCPPRMPL